MKRVKHVGLALIVASIAWSCDDNNANQPEQNRQQEQVETPRQQEAPESSKLDAYGREPGDEHYGHDHARDLDQANPNQQSNPMMQTSPMQQGSPMKIQQTPAPASTGPDTYGRKPGDEHYGHDHPLLPEELNK